MKKVNEILWDGQRLIQAWVTGEIHVTAANQNEYQYYRMIPNPDGGRIEVKGELVDLKPLEIGDKKFMAAIISRPGERDLLVVSPVEE